MSPLNPKRAGLPSQGALFTSPDGPGTVTSTIAIAAAPPIHGAVCAYTAVTSMPDAHAILYGQNYLRLIFDWHRAQGTGTKLGIPYPPQGLAD